MGVMNIMTVPSKLHGHKAHKNLPTFYAMIVKIFIYVNVI